jgi:DNA polymerase-3 subunit alpha
MENLVRAGALDQIHGNRRELIENMDLMLSHADAMRREAESNQVSLFDGDCDVIDDSIRLCETNDWAGMDRLKEEFDALGLYLSAHPLDSYSSQLGRLRVTSHVALNDLVKAGKAPQRVTLAGSVTAKQVRVSQRGNRFAFIQFTDQTGVFEVTFFSDVLVEANDLLDSEKPLLISANLKVENNGPRLLAARVQLLDDAVAAWHGGVALWVQDEKPLKSLKEALKSDGPGKAEVKIQLIVKGQEICIGLPGRFKLSGDLRQELRRMPGILNVREL